LQWVKENIGEVLEEFKVKPDQGLSQQEVDTRQTQYGLNEFEEEKKKTLPQRIVHHLLEIPTMVLIGAAVIAAIAAVMNMENGRFNASDIAKVVVILSIVIINVCLGLYQEGKAEKALEALKKMNAFKTTVIRGGLKQVIEAQFLVPGDIVELNAGDVITADGRLIDSSSLQVEEASLTGESVPVEKDSDLQITETVPLGDRLNMVYSGCLVTAGRGRAVVVATGMETEMGKIAKSLNTTQKLQTPLQLRLKQLAKRISAIALASGVVMFLVGFLAWGNEWIEMLILGVALGVAAVPETLPIIVTMILSHGVYNMVTKKTIIRQIPAVETVGNTSVICSDKTGTLTQNKMIIQRVWVAGNDESTKAKEDFSAEQMNMLELLASCTNASIDIVDGQESVVGDPTEISIVRLLLAKGQTRADMDTKYPRVHELPFDSGRKRMTTVHKTDDGFIAVTKGAFDRMPANWDKALRAKATEIHDTFAHKALRVIAVGYRKYAELPAELSEEALEKDITFLGLVGMIDPPRTESAQAVACAREAGIKTVMITGDHVATAAAIAKEIGIMEEGDRAVTGVELSKMTDEELFEQVRGISVYARVSPEDKMRIVQAWSAHNEVIAMTGDGVNDAPALKAADVGAAMGITGTEVSKNAADMIITDDNFATIVDAIAEGRTSYDNIRKTIQFLLGVNFAEIFVLLVGMLAFAVPTITALQILFINVIADGIPGFCLAFEKPEPGVMKRKPLPKNTGVFAQRTGVFIAGYAITFSALTMAAFAIGSFLMPISPTWSGARDIFYADFATGTTMAFMVLCWASAINAFNVRTTLSIFKSGPMTNRGVFFTVLGSVGMAALLSVFPLTRDVFGLQVVTGWHWLIMGGLSLLQIVAGEIIKAVLRAKDRKAGS